MDTVYITGHRNPDMDSIASAYAYGELKNFQTGEATYQAVRFPAAVDEGRGPPGLGCDPPGYFIPGSTDADP